MVLGHGNGPIPARIMIVGEAWGDTEEERHEPFVGASGAELNRMLHEAGIMRSECYVTNLVNARPPNNDIGQWVAHKKKDITSSHVLLRDKYVLPIIAEGYAQLLQEIEMVQPNIIITLGNTSLWALTGITGVTKWRGSMLTADVPLKPKLISTIHPSAILRQWEMRAPAVRDLRRAKLEVQSREYSGRPEWKFWVRPSFEKVCETLNNLIHQLDQNHEEAVGNSWDEWIDFDLETKAGHIACAGISWSKVDALCIPFMHAGSKDGYWSLEEETQIIWLLYKLLTHPRVKVRGQNLLYDCQYTWKHWHFVPNVKQDTMIAQHSCFCALPKGLGFLGSMYAAWYVYWKDEGKNLDGQLTDDRNWIYNCQDCVYTREAGEVLQQTVESLGLAKVDQIQQALFWPVLAAMQRGVRIIKENRAQMAVELQEAISARRAFLYNVLGHEVNISSPKQMVQLFYEDLQQPRILKRANYGGKVVYAPTCDDDALTKIGTREPILKPIVNAISDIRTLEKLLGDFVFMKESDDGRMRCSFNIAGDAGGKSAPYSYRLSSSQDAFGSGGNLQTIPSKDSKSSGKAAARGSLDFPLPNIRRMYGPDPGYTFFDMDLDRADLQVVAWEADDPMLKAALKMGADVHLLNAFIVEGKEPPPLEELVEDHPRYADHRGPMKHARQFAKVFCHATDYLGRPKTVAEHTGRLIREIERAQRIYLGAYPGIEKWQKRTIAQVTKFCFVENKFGYRWYILDRITDDVMPKAVAWVPQSTVGNAINRAWINIHNNVKEVQVLIQVHDSLAGQGPTHSKHVWVPALEAAARIVVPYEDPLIIPIGIKTSELSWGDCK